MDARLGHTSLIILDLVDLVGVASYVFLVAGARPTLGKCSVY